MSYIVNSLKYNEKSTKAELLDALKFLSDQVVEQETKLINLRTSNASLQSECEKNAEALSDTQVAYNNLLVSYNEVKAELESIPYDEETDERSQTTDLESGDVKDLFDVSDGVAELTSRLGIRMTNPLWSEMCCSWSHDRFTVWFPQSVYQRVVDGNKYTNQQCYSFLGKLRNTSVRLGVRRAAFERDSTGQGVLVIVVSKPRDLA